MQKVAFIIDSSSGLKKSSISKYEDTFLIPMPLSFEDGTEILDDEDLISYDEFYDRLENEQIKTSQIPIGKMIELIDDLLTKYDKIIFIGISKGLSGQHQSMLLLSNEDKYKDKLVVLDTDGVSILNARILDYVYKEIKNGTPIEQLQGKIDNNKDKQTIFIIPKSLDTLKRGGRISPAAAALASFLKITPILRYDGKIDKFDKTRTFKKAVETSLEQIKKERESRDITLLYSKLKTTSIEEIKKIITDQGFNLKETHILSNNVAAHTGADTVVLVCQDF